MATLLTIQNNHRENPPTIDTTGRYVGVFHNIHGEQAVLLIDAETGTGEFMHGDAGWEKHQVSKEQMFPKMILGAGEKLWILACWSEVLRMTNEELVRQIMKL